MAHQQLSGAAFFDTVAVSRIEAEGRQAGGLKAADVAACLRPHEIEPGPAEAGETVAQAIRRAEVLTAELAMEPEV